MTIAIAGGGIAGLAAAIALANTGRHVTVYEQGQAFTELGAGVQIGPNGVRALQHLGAWDALSAIAPGCILIRDGATGRRLTEIALGKSIAERYRAPYVVTHRADLLAALLETAKASPNIELTGGTAVAGLEWEGEGPILILSAGGTVRPQAVVGADGLHSVIRASLHGRAAPEYAGHTMYRALIGADAARLDTDSDAVSLWLFPGGHVVHYAVSGERVSLAAFAESPDEPSWNAPAGRSELLEKFSNVAPPLQRILESAGRWQKWPAADRASIARWGTGAVTLIGDAAHPALPYLAQGAVMALEDAVVLGRIVADAEPLPRAFRTYENTRHKRTARLQRLSRRQGSIYHLEGPMRLARNAVLRALPPSLLLRQLDWLYAWRPA